MPSVPTEAPADPSAASEIAAEGAARRVASRTTTPPPPWRDATTTATLTARSEPRRGDDASGGRGETGRSTAGGVAEPVAGDRGGLQVRVAARVAAARGVRRCVPWSPIFHG